MVALNICELLFLIIKVDTLKSILEQNWEVGFLRIFKNTQTNSNEKIH
jgi:hypothetical protein